VDQKPVMATMVLAAGLPGRLETAQRMVDLLSASDRPARHDARIMLSALGAAQNSPQRDQRPGRR